MRADANSLDYNVLNTGLESDNSSESSYGQYLETEEDLQRAATIHRRRSRLAGEEDELNELAMAVEGWSDGTSVTDPVDPILSSDLHEGNRRRVVMDRSGGQTLGLSIDDSTSPDGGVVVTGVTPGGQADQLHIQGSERILSVNGTSALGLQIADVVQLIASSNSESVTFLLEERPGSEASISDFDEPAFFDESGLPMETFGSAAFWSADSRAKDHTEFTSDPVEMQISTEHEGSQQSTQALYDAAGSGSRLDPANIPDVGIYDNAAEHAAARALHGNAGSGSGSDPTSAPLYDMASLETSQVNDYHARPVYRDIDPQP